MESFLFPIIALTLLGVLIVGVTAYRGVLDFLTIFNGFYLIGYVLSPLHIFIGGEDFAHSNVRNVLVEYNIGTAQAVVAIWLVWILVTVGFLYTRDEVEFIRYSRKPVITRRLTIGIIVGATLFAAISTILYSTSYGGIVESIRLASQIRAGEIEEGGPLVFFKQPIGFALVAVVLTFGLVLRDRIINRKRIALGAAVLLVTVLMLGIRASRITPITIVATCYFTLAAYTRQLYLKTIAVLGVLGVFFIAFNEVIFNFSSYGVSGAISHVGNRDFYAVYAAVWRQFSHLYLSLEVAIANPEYSPRHIIDWVYGVLHLLPSTALGVEVPGTVAHYNTYIIAGEFVSMVIPGLVAFLWYSGTWVGIIIGGALYGVVGGLLDKWLRSFERDPVQLVFYFSIALIWGFQFVRAGDPRILFRGQIVWFITMGVLGLYWLYRTGYGKQLSTRLASIQDNKQ